MQGKIIRGIGGFYYVHVSSRGVYECKAKGIFRNKKVKPLVGDDVTIEVIDEETKTGNITEIHDRCNQLIRPLVANVDQALVVFAASEPEPNLNLLDRFLLMMEMEQVPTIICFNKMDIVEEKVLNQLQRIYENSSYEVLTISAGLEQGLETVKDLLQGKTTVLAGPSGVGKSSLINGIYPVAQMQTGTVSEKIKRGRHTTRHSELFCIEENTYVMDTPGFSSLKAPDIEKEQLRNYFPEFYPYAKECRFLGCMHMNEPDCSVKNAVENGKISKERYENYKLIFEEVKQQKKY